MTCYHLQGYFEVLSVVEPGSGYRMYILVCQLYLSFIQNFASRLLLKIGVDIFD